MKASPCSLLLTAAICLGSHETWSAAPGVLPEGIKLTPKVFGPAQPASNAEFGAVVAITYRLSDGLKHICTGTSLTKRLILTAGHCGCGVPGTYVVSRSQSALSGNPSTTLRVDGVPILFDQRVCTAGQLAGGNDLALVRLAEGNGADDVPLKPEEVGYPPEMVIDLRGILTKGMRLTVVGYGFTSDQRIGTRMQGKIPIVSFDCEERTLGSFCAPFSEMILADNLGPRTRTDTCGGDSGGPVFAMVNGRRRLIGVTSRAAPGTQDNRSLHCGGGGIYTLIGRLTVRRWLQANGVPQAN